MRFKTYNPALKHPGLLPTFSAATIDAYQTGTLLASDTLTSQFTIAKNLLESFRQERLSTSQVFDAVKLARFFAICDLLGNYHATGVVDLRFYYNPITSVLEPIGYDFNGFRLLSPHAGEMLWMYFTPSTVSIVNVSLMSLQEKTMKMEIIENRNVE